MQAFEAQSSIGEAVTFNVSVTARAGRPAAYRDLQVAVTGKARNKQGWLVVQGTVTNPTGAPRRGVSVVVAGFDAGGNLEDVGSSFTSPSDLGPGESGTFSAALPGNGDAVTDVRTSAEAYDVGITPTENVPGSSSGFNPETGGSH